MDSFKNKSSKTVSNFDDAQELLVGAKTLPRQRTGVLAAAALKQPLFEEAKGDPVKYVSLDNGVKSSKKKRTLEERVQKLQLELESAKAEVRAYTERDAQLQLQLGSVHHKFKTLVEDGAFREIQPPPDDEDDTESLDTVFLNTRHSLPWPVFEKTDASNSVAEKLRAMKAHVAIQRMRALKLQLLAKKDRCASFRHRWRDPEIREELEDSVTGFFVLADAVYIGLQADLRSVNGHSVAWDVGDIFFSVFFVAELIYDMVVYGPRKIFCGPRWKFNTFNAIVVCVNVVELVAKLISPTAMSGSQWRIFRLVRLLYLVRLLEIDALEDLFVVLRSVIAGTTPFVMGLALFFVVVYVFALTFKALLEDSGDEHVAPYFGNLARSLLLMYRCILGECSNKSGAPIFVHVYDKISGATAFVYCVFEFVVTLGLLNVLAAVLTEKVLHSAAQLEEKEKHHRLTDTRLWYQSLHVILRKIQKHESSQFPSNFLEEADVISRMGIPCFVIGDIFQDEEVQDVLEDLDIYRDDHDRLKDILDSSDDGWISIGDLMQGLQKLRGTPRRSDIIEVDLMVRYMQEDLLDLYRDCLALREVVALLPGD
eukprot:TRINITY_DN54430_c0_g1_i1.p1 TRINITY_DN54430_c0_g1~~TRINITY_DN54430_c0_g1_i1.p1  ORF type:complete len:596 (+),score=92.65 TRINITY_DN54430_c0_g1_i1:65-1852(+)